MSVKIIKEEKNEYNGLTIVDNKGEQFKIHYAGGDLYWTMIDYHNDNEFIIDEGMSDYQMLINYLTDELKGNLSEKYSDVEGRITIK